MVRTALAAALLLSTLAVAAPVHAAETETPVTEAALEAVTAAPVVADAPVGYSRVYRKAQRSALLPSLYISLAALEGGEGRVRVVGLQGGAVEANPMMQGVVGNPLMFTAIKAGVTGASILAAENLWKHGKKTQAVLLMVASNGLMAYVAHNNAGVLRSIR